MQVTEHYLLTFVYSIHCLM